MVEASKLTDRQRFLLEAGKKKSDKCIIAPEDWSRTGPGYVKVSYKSPNGRSYSSGHGVAWVLKNGDTPEGSYFKKSCEVPDCVNPEHTYLEIRRPSKDPKNKVPNTPWRDVAVNVVEMFSRTKADGFTIQDVVKELLERSYTESQISRKALANVVRSQSKAGVIVAHGKVDNPNHYDKLTLWVGPENLSRLITEQKRKAADERFDKLVTHGFFDNNIDKYIEILTKRKHMLSLLPKPEAKKMSAKEWLQMKGKDDVG